MRVAQVSSKLLMHYRVIKSNQIICDLPVAISFGLHLDAAIVDVAVRTGNCRCRDRLRMVAVAVAQSVAAQTAHHVDHLVERQTALVKFEKSLAAEVIAAAGLLKVNHYLYCYCFSFFFSPNL